MATIPSIAMIPSGVKASKLYSVLPTNGAGDFTTTRASVATRVNENGLIEEVAANVPRLDYSDGTCPSLLLEPASTNLIPYSEDFSNVAWNKSSLIATSTLDINPSGTGSAYKIITDSGVAISSAFIYEILSGLTPSVAHSYSVFAKKSELNSIRVAFDDGVTLSNRGEATFNLNDGSISNIQNTGNFSGVTAKSENYGNGWYRCTVSSVVNTTGQTRARVYNSDTTITTGDGAKGVLVYGAQLEENSYSTSYIKTIGTTQTRVADTATGSGNSTVINSTEGVLYAEISALANDGSFRQLTISDGSGSNRVSIDFTSTDNQIRSFSSSGGGAVANMTGSVSNATQFNKVAVKYKLNDYALWINGVEVATDTSGNAPIGLSELAFDNGTSSNNFYGKTKSVQVYTTALSDAELTSLTTI
mgnify:CR=1 FL=1